LRLSCFAAVLILVVFPLAGGAQQLHLQASSAQLRGPNLHLVDPPTNETGAPSLDSPAPYISGFQDDADVAEFSIKAPSAGLYDLAIAFRSSGRKGFAVKVNDLEIAGTIAKTPASSFMLQSVGIVELNKGKNVVEIEKGWGYFEVESIQLTPTHAPNSAIASSTAPVDTQILPEAAALLSHLQSDYGKTTLLGVYSSADAQYVADTTSRLPSIMGGDLLAYSPQEVAHGSHPEKADEVDRLIAASRAGYIVTLSWHWCSPSGLIDSKEKPWWRGFYTDSTNFDVQATLADPTSADYTTMLSDIDTIAVQLRRLQEAHVAVLWRPLHEASGGWFWWGAKGPSPFIQLWQLLYDRLTNVDGIHNLIWVYTGDGDKTWYPGDKYVDVVGIDAYPKDLRDPESKLWSDLRQNYGDRKLLTISEFGGVPDVPRMQRLGEFWSYAVSWSGKEGPKKNSEDELKRIYASPGVTTMPIPVAPPATASNPDPPSTR
jgi:mannan endo-1,4-beta-mannosidase